MRTTVASPLTVILEHLKAGQAINSALFVSYTFDAGYFEKIALAPLEGCGATVAILADASQVVLDPYAARRIGRRYALGLVHHHHPFHPKLVVFEGDGRATIGIGSANLTMAGWHSNEELWTFIETDEKSWPPVVTDVGAWLELLADLEVVGPRITQYIKDVGRRLQQPTLADDTARLLSNVERPIIEQLPTGPVDALHLYAPFHDRQATAVRSLIERLRPKVTELAYQPGMTSLDASGVRQLVDESTSPPTIRRLSTDRYRHGKLIEWRVGDQWWAVTGSPNLSSSALACAAGTGNFELAILTATDEQLLPAGEELGSLSVLADETLTVGPRVTLKPAVNNFEASAEGDNLKVTLTQAAPDGVVAEAIPLNSPPDLWQTWDIVPAGRTTFELPVLAGGSWLRLRFASGRVSGAASVIGPTVFQHRTSKVGGSARHPEVDELFDDPALADRFFQQLQQLKDETRNDSSTVVRTTASTSPSMDGRRIPDWEEYLDQLSGRLGSGLLRYALGIPSALSGGSSLVIADWDEEVPEDTAGLEGDDPEDSLELIERSTLNIPSTRSWSDKARVRAVRLLNRLVELDEPTHRLLALRLTLGFVAGGAWPKGDSGWMDLVLRHLDGIADDPIEEPALRSRQGSLSALAVSVMRTRVPRIPATTTSIRIDRASSRLLPLWDELDDDALDEYCQGLDQAFGVAASAEQIIESVLDSTGDDAISRAVRALGDFGGGIDAERRGGVLLLPSQAADPVGLGLMALKALGKLSQGVVQVGTGKEAVVLIWTPPRLLILRTNKNNDWWANAYDLPATYQPTDYANVEDLPKSKMILSAMNDWAEAKRAVATVGLDPDNPACDQ